MSAGRPTTITGRASWVRWQTSDPEGSWCCSTSSIGPRCRSLCPSFPRNSASPPSCRASFSVRSSGPICCSRSRGWLLDRFGPRAIVGGAGVVWGLFQMLGGAATGAAFLTVSRLGLGASEAPVFPAGAKLNANWLPPKERARGATFIDAAGPFGSAVGGLIVTWIIGATGGWRWAFVITGAITILVAAAYWFYLRDRPTDHRRVNAGELAKIEDQAAGVAAEETARQLPRIADYLRSRSFWGMMFGRLGWATIWWGIISWTPSYLSQAFGFSLAALGWGTFVVYGSGVLGQVVAGFTVDRWRQRTSRYNLIMKIIFGVSGVGTAAAIFAIPPVTDGMIALALLSIAVFFINFGGLYWAIRPGWRQSRRSARSAA